MLVFHVSVRQDRRFDRCHLQSHQTQRHIDLVGNLEEVLLPKNEEHVKMAFHHVLITEGIGLTITMPGEGGCASFQLATLQASSLFSTFRP